VDRIVADRAEDKTGEATQPARADDHQASVVGGTNERRPCRPLVCLAGRDKARVLRRRAVGGSGRDGFYAHGALTFDVTDNGKGFDAASVQRGAGLTNMTDRIDALGGSLEMSSTPGSGTRIFGSLPAPVAAAAS